MTTAPDNVIAFRPLDQPIAIHGTWARTALGDLVNLAHAAAITAEPATDDPSKFALLAVYPPPCPVEQAVILGFYSTQRAAADATTLILEHLAPTK